jgi:nucleoside-diphosphate-sugar epimerase
LTLNVNILIVGASGNLGSHLSKHLLGGPHRLRLLTHKRALPFELPRGAQDEIAKGDLDDPDSLRRACKDVDCIVYLAGVLFQPRPESFLHRTNTVFVRNMVDAALSTGVRKFILVSFPHVEENTTPDAPAMGRLDVHPKSIHGRTRLDAEKYLFAACEDKTMQALVLRAGVIYGRGIKLTEAARWLMRRRLLAVWREPTWVHLLALPDFLTLVELSIKKGNLSGIYNLGDDRALLMQEFLDRLAAHWGYRRPWRLPAFIFYWMASVCETAATVLRTRTPLNRDIINMAMTSVVADTERMKQELMPQLAYPTLEQGLTIV